jgi:hypothetical protein
MDAVDLVGTMSSAADDILVYVLYLLWTCFSLAPAKLKNPFYSMVLSTQDVVQQLLSDS